MPEVEGRHSRRRRASGARRSSEEQAMAIGIILAGVTGWVGRALVPAIARAGDLALVGAVARSAAGRDAGEAAGVGRLGVTVSGSLIEALATPADVLIDYTRTDVVKHH